MKSKNVCSYAGCRHCEDKLVPCESTGLCPRVCHEACFLEHNPGQGGRILCAVCSNNVRSRKRHRDDQPPSVTPQPSGRTRSLSATSEIQSDDPVRVCLFPTATATPTPVEPERTPHIRDTSAFVVPIIRTPVAPVTPAMAGVIENVTPMPKVRPGRGGKGREAAKAFVPGSGAVADPFQKKYNVDPKRSVVREFNVEEWQKRQRRKTNAVDHFFAVAQNEKYVQDGSEHVTFDEIHEAFGSEMPAQTRYRYRGHEGCNMLQEILMTLMYLKKASGFDDLASKWLGSTSKVARTTARNICITWIAYIYTVSQANPMWIPPERADKICPEAFKVNMARCVGHIADCTNLDMGNCQRSNPLVSSLLTSHYYKGICVKYLIDISRCGGVCAVSCSHGGSKASDERLMESAGYFDPERCQWRYSEDHDMSQGVMYDGGVDKSTVGRCQQNGFRCVRTGTRRKDKRSTLSFLYKTIVHVLSTLRIRVENKIGDGKGQCKILSGRHLSIDMLAIVHKIIYVSWYLMNFNFPTIV